MQLKRIKTITIIVGLFVFLFSINQTKASPCSQLDSNVAVPDGYGASFNPHSNEEELIIKADCLEDTVEIELGNGTETQYVYSKGYIYDDSRWQPITFTGDEEVNSWFKGSARSVLSLNDHSFSGQKYIVVYVCTWIDDVWKCGCRDRDCNQNLWQLQIVDRGITVNQQCRDNDRDGYGDPSAYCASSQVDCDDTNEDINPGAAEICGNDIDENCDGLAIEECDPDQVICEDKDRDKFDTCFSGQQGDDGRELDCDDTTKYVNPISRETCDNQDNDCDGEIDEGCDDDEDGYCDIYLPFFLNDNDSLEICPFSKDSGTEKGDDCNDSDGNKNPGTREECDEIDNNCNGVIDEDGVCCNDLDHDGYDDCNPSIDGDDNKQKDCNDENSAIYPGREEICDEIDNNCDGIIDPDCECISGETRICGTDEGICQAGTQTCGTGIWSICVDEIVPQMEICGNGIDENCDGEDEECNINPPVINDFDVQPRTAEEDSRITVTFGIDVINDLKSVELWRSIDQENWTKVSEIIYPRTSALTEYSLVDYPSVGMYYYGLHVVDVLDNMVIEPNGPIQVTITRTSTCEDYDGDGYDNCSTTVYGDDGRQEDCNDHEFYANPGIGYDTCDTVDNNCNGQIDEGCDDDGDGFCNQEKTIYRTNSMCPRTPYIEGRYGNDCNDHEFYANPGITETCDGVDNNCNKIIDENCDCVNDTTQDCGSNIGECQTGTQICRNGAWSSCQGEITVQREICDGLDNDCNDLTDENLVTPLNDNQEGVCEGSMKECDGTQGWQNTYTSITSNEYPTETSCDGLDNNCDGRIDENCDCVDNTTQDCGSNIGICQAGIMTCQNGEWSICEGEITPRNEICGNGIDEDCDGGDLECDSNCQDLDQDGYDNCSPGTQGDDGSLMDCDDNEFYANPGIGYDTCDTVDNNCNGQIDEGCDDDNDGYCDGTKTIYRNNSMCLNTPFIDGRYGDDCDDNEFWANPGGAETCDTLDNNCNEQIDEGCDDDGDGFCNQEKTIYRTNSMCPRTPYIEGRYGNDCNDTASAINPGVTEICSNSIDDNCDGQVDENCLAIRDRFGIDAAVVHGTINFPEIISEIGDGISGANAICYFEDYPIKTREDLKMLDDLYNGYKAAGRTLQVNLLSCTGNEDGGAPVTQLPDDLEAYKDWIKGIVNKYKGNIFYYQIDSEPSSVAFTGTKENFVTMLNAGYDAIKEVDPNAIVMTSGWSFLGLYIDDPSEQELEDILIYLETNNKTIYTRLIWLLDTFEYVLENGKYDVVSINHNRYYNAATGIVKKIRKYSQKPIIFVDMMSGPASAGFLVTPSKYYPDYASYYLVLEDRDHPNYEVVKNIVEAEHSRVLVKKSIFAFAKGVDKVFISWTVDTQNFPVIMWNHQGLLGVESLSPAKVRKKPAFYTSKLLVSKIDKFISTEQLNDYTYKFLFTDKDPVYVLWSDDGDKNIDLSSHFDTNNILITRIVTEQGQTEPKTEQGQANSILVNNTPIFIE